MVQSQELEVADNVSNEEVPVIQNQRVSQVIGDSELNELENFGYTPSKPEQDENQEFRSKSSDSAEEQPQVAELTPQPDLNKFRDTNLDIIVEENSVASDKYNKRDSLIKRTAAAT